MIKQLSNSDRGAGLVEYALCVVLIAIVSLVGVGAAGSATSDTFDTIGASFGGPDEGSGLSPEEKWELAQNEYAAAIDEAKAKKADDLADAKAQYDAAVDANSDLPKNDKKAANQQAKNDYNAAKAAANGNYKSSVDSAKAARDAAKAEYKASK